jgi:hypothetical protein
MPNAVRPIELFYSYSHKDQKLRQKLDDHLSGLQQQGIIAGWHDGEITAGDDWSQEICDHLDRADIVLLLVSSSFMSSKYCNKIELQRAIVRHAAGRAKVIPVILRSCVWQPTLGKFQALPSTGTAVIDWSNRDAAFTDIVKGISKAAEELRENAKGSRGAARVQTQAENPTITESYRRYHDASHAFSAARKRLEESFTHPHRGGKTLTADLKLLAIAMTQSWSFVSHDLPAILQNHPKATIRIQVLLSDPDFLDSLQLDTDFDHWAERCRQNIDGLKHLMRHPICAEGRLVIHLRIYRQIPQWHGLLVNKKHLFMGRTKWSFETPGPKLTVGQNFYRGYPGDSERVSLFETWHRYYFDFYSEEVVLPPSGSPSGSPGGLRVMHSTRSSPKQDTPLILRRR